MSIRGAQLQRLHEQRCKQFDESGMSPMMKSALAVMTRQQEQQEAIEENDRESRYVWVALGVSALFNIGLILALAMCMGRWG